MRDNRLHPLQELLPLVFMFELPVTGALQPIPDNTSPIIQQIQQTYSVTVTFKQRPRVYVTTVIVRGSVSNAKAVKEATAILMKHLTGNQAVSIATGGSTPGGATYSNNDQLSALDFVLLVENLFDPRI